MSKYIAKQSVGRFRLGEEVEGLTEKRAKFLLEEGAIEEVEEQATKAEPKTESKAKPKAAAKDKD